MIVFVKEEECNAERYDREQASVIRTGGAAAPGELNTCTTANPLVTAGLVKTFVSRFRRVEIDSYNGAISCIKVKGLYEI
jgi:hypothetical protein